MKQNNGVVKKLLVSVSALSLTALLGGCGSFLVGDENLSEAVDLPDVAQSVGFTRQWQASIGDGTDKKSLHLRPTVVDNRVFVVSADGTLEARELTTGKRIWQQDIGQCIAAGVAADNNLVVVSSEDGLLMAFSAGDGSAGWTYQASTEILTPPTIVNGLVIARAIDGQITALNARSGQPVWKQYIGVSDLSIRGNARGIYLDGAILYTNEKGRMTILSVTDGKPVASTPLVRGKGMTAVDQIADLLATPVVRNGVLFVSAYRQKTLALNLRDGSLLWQSPYSTDKDLFADDKFVYLIDKNSLISALDMRTGKLAWTKNTLEGRRISPVIGNGAWIATIDQEGIMSFLDSNNGNYLGRTDVGGKRSYIAPIVTSAGILTYTSDGDLTLTKPVAP
ncbi:MAG: outer membrane protein assembly factor BamB [Gammaproteobacteria bacterium]|nr:outer membrane protein assembly factor BamB [Gammaproteobacteria bacterium]